MGERCGCSFSTLPGKQLRCIEATRHQGPHHADGVTWTQLFPKRSEEVPDGRRLGLEGWAPATTAAPAKTERCPCGHNREAHPLHYGICACGITRLSNGQDAPNGKCMGWPGTVGADTLEQNQTLRDKVADLEVYAAGLHEALVAIAAHFTGEVAFPSSPLGKVRDALTAQPPQHRQQLQDKIANLEVYAAELHDLLSELHERGPTRTLHAKITDALAAQPPQHRRQLLGYQTSDGRLYRPEDITLVYDLDQGVAQGGEP